MSKKTLRRALITSVVSLVLCFAMLLGATYAWFTDTASTGVNTIASGNLDMVLEYYDGTKWEKVDSSTKLFGDALFEPGAVQIAYVRVKNAGDLAFKYKLNVVFGNEIPGVNVAGVSFKLSDYLETAVVDMGADFAPYSNRAAAIAAATADGVAATSFEGNLAKKATSNAIALIVYMPETVDNVANHNGTDIPSLELGVSAVATQDTVERDAFDDQYDASAAFPEAETTAVPHPTVTSIPGSTLDDVVNASGPVPFDVGLKFVANEDESDEFGDYLCDFVLTFNQDVEGTGNVYLYGNYGDYGTLGAPADNVIFHAGEGAHVIADLLTLMIPGIEVPYSYVIEEVQEFYCYLHVEHPTAGLTATLQLVMTPPATAENPNPEEIEIYSFTYAYPGN